MPVFAATKNFATEMQTKSKTLQLKCPFCQQLKVKIMANGNARSVSNLKVETMQWKCPFCQQLKV